MLTYEKVLVLIYFLCEKTGRGPKANPDVIDAYNQLLLSSIPSLIDVRIGGQCTIVLSRSGQDLVNVILEEKETEVDEFLNAVFRKEKE